MARLTRMSVTGIAALVAVAVLDGAQEPRFRGGANLVRLDVYASANGAAVTNLTAADFEVFEDNAPQEVTSFEFVPARGPVPEALRVESNTVGEMRSRAAQSDGRLFVLFLDTGNVQLRGSFRAASPVAEALDRIVGADDLLGVMTPDMTPGNMTLSPRTAPIGEMLRANWAWGERGRRLSNDPGEAELQRCYGDDADALIARRRELKTLQALTALTAHLEGLRDERTFVLLLTEGWLLPRPDERLAEPAGPDPLAVTPDGRLGTASERGGGPSPACRRERSLVALSDLAMEFRLMMQRANRANISFYPVDARGLIAFDRDDIAGSATNPSLMADNDGLNRRRNAMRELAAETDGTVVVDSALDTALPRVMADLGSSYLLGYVSTNTKLDGRYRRLAVGVTRPGVTVRARPGYLAPSAADVAAVQTSAATSRATSTPSTVSDALSRLPASRRAAVLHLQASGAPGHLSITVELDRGTAAQPEWAKGGRLSLALEPADRGAGTRASVVETLVPGARVHTMHLPDGADQAIVAGRYQVRVEALAEGARTPLVISIIVDVPGGAGLLGSALLAARRGPGTGRAYEPTADARFRRTERLRAEVARLDAAAVVTGRLLNRAGQSMQVPVTITERPGTDHAPATVVAELALAPLAAGEYVLEVMAAGGDRTETRSYAIRLVP